MVNEPKEFYLLFSKLNEYDFLSKSRQDNDRFQAKILHDNYVRLRYKCQLFK